MHQASSEAARRQIVEFEELVSRFERINDDSKNATISLDSGLDYYGIGGVGGGGGNNGAAGSTLSLDKQQQQQLSDLAILESLARLSRSSARASVFLDQNSRCADVAAGSANGAVGAGAPGGLPASPRHIGHVRRDHSSSPVREQV